MTNLPSWQEQRTAALQFIAAAWLNLSAWRPVDLRGVRVAVKFRRQRWASTGLASTSRAHGQADVIVRLGEDEADGLAALLHELAHVAAARRGHSGHDRGWREIFRAAAREVTGEEIADVRANVALTDLVADAIRRKWQFEMAAGRTTRAAEDEADESARK